MNRVAKVVSIALAAAAVIALSGCGEIETASPNGQGTCGSDAVTLTTAQNAQGDQFTIHYEGPSGVSLLFNQGFYSDEAIGWYTPPFTYEFTDSSNGANGTDAYVIALDTSGTGWTTGGSDPATTYDFSGSLQDLLGSTPTGFDLMNLSGGSIINSIFPSVIGVSCTPGVVTNAYLDTNSDGLADGVSYQVAQSIFPGSMQFNPYEIVSASSNTTGTDLTFRYSADAASTFGSFVPAVPSTISMVNDDPNVANDTIMRMWLQFLLGENGGSINLNVSSPVDNGDGTFTVNISDNGGPLEDGNYLLFSPLSDQNMTEAKLVFSQITYTAASGVAVLDPFTGTGSAISFDSPAQPAELASTGTNGQGLAGAVGVSAALLLAGCATLVARRRRTHRS